ncbi:MAG: hypothetical protein MI702_10045, partial [Chlorobiales bacterium]|nr:hypothetical protein [Chlorobiales bacterium]
MPADDYLILLGHLLDDDLNEEQQQRLLSILEQHPEKFPDIMRHLELWELYSQSVCTERSAERFLASWETRVAAVADADQFIQDVERRLEATSVAEQARIQEIKQRAQRELEQFLAEHKPVAPARESRRRKEWHVGERIRKGLENFCNLLVMSLKVVRVLAVCLAVALAIPTTLRYIQAKRIVATLDDSVSAKWTTPPEQPQLRRGWLELQEGFAQLSFKGGAQAILQAPCKLRLESSEQLFLETGTLAVKLIESEQTFLVRTSHSTIKDLGTEFGVIV